MRVSSLPAFLDCPSSALTVEHPYDPSSDAADMGTAVHVALAVHVMGRIPDLDGIAEKYHIDCNELEQLFAYGCIAWKEIGKYFPNARTEEVLKGDGIGGHADVFHRDEMTMCVADWKTNRARSNCTAQLRGYAACAVDQFGMPESGEVKVITVWVRLFEYDVVTVTADDVERLHHDIKRAKFEIGKRYAPGDSCAYCRRQLICGARHEFLASATAALLPVGEIQLTHEFLPLLYSKSKMLSKALDVYRKALGMALKEHGPMSDGQGHMLELVETKRDKMKPREAWPLLIEHGFDEDELANCTTMSKTAVMDVVASKVKRGQKGKAKFEFLETLKRHNAVTETTYDTIKLKKGEQQ